MMICHILFCRETRQSHELQYRKHKAERCFSSRHCQLFKTRVYEHQLELDRRGSTRRDLKAEMLTLSFNHWIGTLPSGVFTLQNLRVFWLDMDMMTLPDLHSYVNMEELRFHSVRLRQGPIPKGVEKVTKLVVLQLSWCNFTGSIPVFLQHLMHLKVINLDNNSLSGNIRSECVRGRDKLDGFPSAGERAYRSSSTHSMAVQKARDSLLIRKSLGGWHSRDWKL